MFKAKNHLSPEIVADTFLQQSKIRYYLRYHNDFRTFSTRSVYCRYTNFDNRNA